MSLPRVLLALTIITACAPAASSTFVWDGKNTGQQAHMPKVLLANKVIIEEARGREMFDQSVTALAPKSRSRSVVVKNDLVKIEAAYPNPRNASVVLTSDTCSGNACYSKTMTAIVPQGESFKAYRVNSPSRITLQINDGIVIDGHADGISAGTNAYGDDVSVTYRFLPGAGFVAPGFKAEYAKLIGEHPDSFFANDALRNGFAKAIGLENFRDLRQATGVAGPIVLVQGRYIVVQGCMPHECDSNSGIVVIDAVKLDYFWARFSEGKNRYSGGTRKLDASFDAVIHDDEFPRDLDLVVSPKGRLVYQPKS